MGPGQNPQYTRAHFGGEAVGCSPTTPKTLAPQEHNRQYGSAANWFNAVPHRACSSLTGLFPRRAKSETTLLSVHSSGAPDPVTDGAMDNAVVKCCSLPTLAVQTVLKTVEIPQEQFLVEKVLDMHSGVHHQNTPQVQLIDKVADVSA